MMDKGDFSLLCASSVLIGGMHEYRVARTTTKIPLAPINHVGLIAAFLSLRQILMATLVVLRVQTKSAKKISTTREVAGSAHGRR